MMEVKPFWASKTLWVNLFAGVATVSTAFGFDLGLDPETQVAIVGGIIAVANMILRAMTKTAVSV
jgi:hypothetical protein